MPILNQLRQELFTQASAEELSEITALFCTTSCGQVIYDGANSCLTRVNKSDPLERDCLYELQCVLTPEKSNTRLLSILEGVYSA